MEYDIKDYLEKKACTQIVTRSKYETQNKETQKWWQNQFKELEEKHAMPGYKRKSYLKKIFSDATLDHFRQIGLEVKDDGEEIVSKVSEGVVKSSKQSLRSGLDIRKKQKEEEETNPFLNFIKKPREEAEIWRPQKPVSLEDLSLMEKAENITDNLAEDFDIWFKNMGGQRKTEINKEVILELFEMVFAHPAATSLCVQVKELGSVSQQIADSLRQPKFAESAAIRKHINRDVKAMKLKPHMVAFGKTLPLSLRRKPFTENVQEKWLTSYVYYDKIASMAGIWEGIEELQSTRSFCKYLLHHPDIPEPPYLKAIGLMSLKRLAEPIYLACQVVDLDESFEDLLQSTK